MDRASIATTGLVAAAVLLLVYFLASFIAARRFVYKLQKAGFPMPAYHPIFGHLLVLKEQMDNLPADCTTNSSFLGIGAAFPNGMYYFDLWPFAKPLLIVNTISGAEQLMRTPLMKPHIFDDAMNHLCGGQTLLTMPDKPWKEWRALFNPAFSPSYMLELVPAIVKEAVVFCDILDARAKSGEMFQLENLTLKLTIDVIGAASVDSRWNYQIHDHPLACALRRQIEWTTFQSEMNPWDRYHPLRPLILWYNGRKISKLIDQEILSRYEELRTTSTSTSTSTSTPTKTPSASASTSNSKNPKASRSIISLTLKEYLKENNLSTSTTLSPSFLKLAGAQLRLFLFAGHDTTSSTLIYCYHNLSSNPRTLVLLRAEHDSVFGSSTSNTVSTVAAAITANPNLLNALSYTLACIKETLRLFPPASAMRVGSPDVSIVDDDGKVFPTDGCWVWAMQLALHRNPKYFPDPNSFLPERWLANPSDPLYPPKGAWRPFEFGPRNCLGQTLAVTELKIVLALTVRRFDVRQSYEAWDGEKGIRGRREVQGERAYQVEGGGGGAHPSERYPCTVAVRG
ncbi:cytochrome P450 monooxygenase [Lentithecium fluviatile CBS 122367]|uniref:Cytochrome P450 monooxygenase n=1 Tax=Lentithecium fluviatile CBS 122367 TaxID=1168545 RepID=A0A6G1IMP5_9PLEO|nr:cytochrome P450 monooxygenase [Lentithecium fluviatile CBS 122367]